MAQTAVKLKSEGNELFKAGKHTKYVLLFYSLSINLFFSLSLFYRAAQLYAKASALFLCILYKLTSSYQAEEADPEDPVYPSNLSAALYETADYLACAKAVLRSWKLLKDSSTAKQDLISRLSTRLAKCLAHGLLDGSISDDFVEDHVDDISQLRKASLENAPAISTAPASAELSKAWKLWDSVNRADSGSREYWAADAMKRFLSLPHRRQTEYVLVHKATHILF